MEEELEEIIEEEMEPKETRGGYRPNAGRKKGSKNLIGLPRKAIMEYTSPQELKNMVERAKKLTRKSEKMLQWYLEQVFGKAKVIEREGAAKTTNNIAVFLDKLEQSKLDGSTIIRQNVETETPLLDYRPETEADIVSSE